MIYLVSRQKTLIEVNSYKSISCVEAINKLESLSEVQLDTETSGLDPHSKALLTLQLGCKEFQVVFDWTTMTNEEKNQVKEYLESDRLFIGVNLMFDLCFLYKQDIWPKNIYDIMVVEQLIYLGYPRVLTAELVEELGISFPMYEYVDKDKNGKYIENPHWELSYSLKAIAKRRLGIDIDKTVRGDIITKGLTKAVIIYAAGDVEYLEDIRDSQLADLEKEDLVNAAKFESEFVKSLAYVKFCGVHLDAEKWKQKMAKDEKNLNDALEKLNQFVIDLDSKKYIYREATTKKEIEKVEALKFERCSEPNMWRKDISGKFVTVNIQPSLFEEFNDLGPKCTINWSSSQQVIKLFELLGIQVKTFDKKTKKEKKSVEEKLIAPQADKFPIINTYLDYQAAAKVVSTYGENWLKAINPVTGRVHAELHPIGTDTSRISSGGGPYKVNILNLPRDAGTRACFTAAPGNLFLSADYQSQESRIIASVSEDRAMIDIFKNGCGDVHSLVAYMSYPDLIPRDTKIEDINKKYHELRQEAKGIEFSINYAGDANTIANNKGIPLTEAEKIYNNFMEGFPGVKKYQDYCRKNVAEKWYILMNPLFKHRAHIFDAEWMAMMQQKFSEPGFWQYYNEMKRDAPHCSTVMGVKRFFRRKSDSEKQAVNYRIQNRGAMAYKLSMIKLFNWITSNNLLNKVKICVTPYDEINLEAPEEIAEEVADILLKCMVAGGKPFCPNVYLGADLSRNKDGSLPNCWLH